MIHLVTFASEDMSRAARICVSSAEVHGAEDPIAWDMGHVRGNWELFRREGWADKRGCGFWVWKPWIIEHALRQFADGDILIYSDAGIEFINNVNYVIDRMDQDIFLFGNMYEHAHWCKRDIVDAVWPTNRVEADMFLRILPIEERVRSSREEAWEEATWARFGKQAQASVIFFRVNDYTRAFVKEWLGWCLFEDGRLVDDSPSRTSNHPEFRENRHDQAILTTMAYREGIRLHWWPAMYNDGAFTYERGDYPDEGYPVLFHHHRRRNHEWSVAA